MGSSGIRDGLIGVFRGAKMTRGKVRDVIQDRKMIHNIRLNDICLVGSKPFLPIYMSFK